MCFSCMVMTFFLILTNNRMTIVDRKISLPGDFDIKVAYIYPIAIGDIRGEMAEEEVCIADRSGGVKLQ